MNTAYSRMKKEKMKNENSAQVIIHTRNSVWSLNCSFYLGKVKTSFALLLNRLFYFKLVLSTGEDEYAQLEYPIFASHIEKINDVINFVLTLQSKISQ